MLRGNLARVRRGALLFIVIGLACMWLAGCDSGGPAPAATQTVSAPTSTADAGATPPGGDFASNVLTEVPTAPTPTLVPTPAGFTAEDTDNVYAAVVDALLGERLPPVVYISPDVGQGERLDYPDEASAVPETLLKVLPSSPGTKYEFSEFSQAIGSLDDGGQVKDGGVFVTLGSIGEDPQDKAGVVVRGSIYRKVGDAEGDSFHVKRDTSAHYGWKVVNSAQDWTDS